MTSLPVARQSDTAMGDSHSRGRPEHYSHDPRGRFDESPLPSLAARRLRCAATRIATRAHAAGERSSSSVCRFLPIACRRVEPRRASRRVGAQSSERGVIGARPARSPIRARHPRRGPPRPAAARRGPPRPAAPRRGRSTRRGLSTPPRSVDPTSRQAIQQSRRTSSLTRRPHQGQPTPRALVDSIIINYAMHDAEALYNIHRRL